MKMKKAQNGIPGKKPVAKKSSPKKEEMIESEMFPGKMIPKSKSNYANGEYTKMLEGNRKATLKEAAKKKAPKGENGLREGQYKRIGRIAEKNPLRAERVADRMKTKESRVERGKDIANPPIRSMNMNRRYDLDRIMNMAEGRMAADSKPKKVEMKGGGMLKRADGSYSKRGLWDNIRAAKGSGKKPTAAMLKQEKKIKAKTK